jgi:hypothetical protein
MMVHEDGIQPSIHTFSILLGIARKLKQFDKVLKIYKGIIILKTKKIIIIIIK